MITTINEWKQINESHDNIIRDFINGVENDLDIVEIDTYDINENNDQITVMFVLQNEYTKRFDDDVLMFELTFDIDVIGIDEPEPEVGYRGGAEYKLTLVDYYIGDGGNVNIDDTNELLFNSNIAGIILSKYSEEIDEKLS